MLNLGEVMETRRNLGMVIFLVGIFLILDRTTEFEGIILQLKNAAETYWPFFLCVLGLYILSTPSQKK